MNDTMGNDNIQSGTFYLISSIAITTIAIIGNSTVFLILVKTQFRKELLFRYLIISTVFDTLNALLIWPNTYRDVFLINEQNLNCIVFYFTSDSITSFTSGMNVLTSVDTLMLVKYPTNFQFRKIYKYQMLILFLIIVGSCLINFVDIFLQV